MPRYLKNFLFLAFLSVSLFSITLCGNELKWSALPWKSNCQFSRAADGTLQIVSTDEKRAGAWSSSTIKVTPGNSYRLTAEMSADITAGRVILTVEYLNSKGKRIKTGQIFKISGTQDFRKRSARFEIPENCSAIRLLAILHQASGTAKFRNISVKKDAEIKRAERSQTFKANDLIWKSVSNRGQNEFSADALKFTIARGADQNGSGYWLSSPVSVTEGSHYQIFADIGGRDLRGVAAVSVIFSDAGNKRISTKRLCHIRNSRNFMVSTTKFTVPATAAFMRLRASLDGSGKAYFRNIYLKQLSDDFIFAAGAHIRADRSTRIYWRTAVRNTANATVRFSSSGFKDIVREYNITGAENHKIDLPAGSYPDGTPVTAHISHFEKGEKKTSAAVKFISGSVKNIAQSKKFSIPLSVVEPTTVPRKLWPVRGGIPFHKGVLCSAGDVMLIDNAGKIIPAEFSVLSRWDDGSVQFLIYDFETSTTAGKPTVYHLTNCDSSRIASPAPPVPRLAELLRSISAEITLSDGKVLSASPARKDAVKSNSVCENAVIEGKFSGDKGFGYRLNIRAYHSGTTVVKWSIFGGDADTLIRSLSWNLPALKNPLDSRNKPLDKNFTHLQQNYNSGTGDGFAGEAAGGFSVAIRNYRETWPKGISNNDTSLKLQILPPLPGGYPSTEQLNAINTLIKYYWLKNGCYIFRAGMELTGEFTISFNNAPYQHLTTPLIASASPDYYCSTGVFEKISPKAAGEFDRYEKIIENSFDQLNLHRKEAGEFGWMNFGDWFGERYDNWGNNEYDLAFLMALLYARTAEPRYFFRGLEMAEHYQSIDRYTHLAKPIEKKMKYKHSVGHIGNFVSADDPRFKKHPVNKNFVKPIFDSEGGHDFENGSLLISALAGDDYMFSKTVENIEHLARAFTVTSKIGIERSFGWLLDNLAAGMFFTSDPYIRNGADICFENVRNRQDKINGSLNLPQATTPCKCPDRFDHRGGKPFAIGVLMHAMVNYYNLTNNPDARNCIIKMSEWMLNAAWDEETELFRYQVGCPKSTGGTFYSLAADSLLMAGEWSGDKRYEELIIKHFGRNFQKVKKGFNSQGVAKHFSMAYRHVPHIFHLLKKRGITDLPMNPPKHFVSTPIPEKSVMIEAEKFTSQSGGKVKVRYDKIGADISLSHWAAPGHTLVWNLNNAPGSYKIILRYATNKNGAVRMIRVNGKIYKEAVLPSTGGLGDNEFQWHTLYLRDKNDKDIVLELPENAELSMEVVKDSVNPDRFHLVKID